MEDYKCEGFLSLSLGRPHDLYLPGSLIYIRPDSYFCLYFESSEERGLLLPPTTCCHAGFVRARNESDFLLERKLT